MVKHLRLTSRTKTNGGKNMSINITDEMRKAASQEAKRRADYIKHHFELDYMTPEERDEISFLGEFACKECLGLDWRKGIRENYVTADHGDILLRNVTIDIKTETVPYDKLMRLVKGRVGDDEPYGRRLINENQVPLLEHYDYVVWGAFSRNTAKKVPGTVWFSLGYLETAYILEHYSVTKDTPFGTKYDEPCLNIHHSKLKNINKLIRIIAGQ